MDSMHSPHKFPQVFTCSYLYVFTLTLPNAATVFAAFSAQAALQGEGNQLCTSDCCADCSPLFCSACCSACCPNSC